MVLLHVALYKIHLKLFKKSLDYDVFFKKAAELDIRFDNKDEFKVNEGPSHQLLMANDVLSSMGNDTVVGDSAVLYAQIDSMHNVFEFTVLDEGIVQELSSDLQSVLKRRQDELDAHVMSLDITLRLSDHQVVNLKFADVPFHLSIGNDHITLGENEVLCVGDFATMDIIFSDNKKPSDLPCPGHCLRPYVQSIENLRKKPGVHSFLPRLILYETDFFYGRFDSSTLTTIQPVYHGDTISARSSKNVIFGDYLNAITLEFVNGDGSVQHVYFYGDGSYDNYEWMTDPIHFSLAGSAYYEGQRLDWAADSINVHIGNGSPYWQGQMSSSEDIVNGLVQGISIEDSFVKHVVTRFFFEQEVAKQMALDFYRYSVSYKMTRDLSLGPKCSPGENVFILSHTKSSFLPLVVNVTFDNNPDPVALSPSPTVTLQPTPSFIEGSVWFPLFANSYCKHDGNVAPEPYMERQSADYLFSSAEECCKEVR